jgi:hypothetical protein
LWFHPKREQAADGSAFVDHNKWGREVERLKHIGMPDDDLIDDFRTLAERVNAGLKTSSALGLSALAAHSRSNAISCSAPSRSPWIRSSAPST